MALTGAQRIARQKYAERVKAQRATQPLVDQAIEATPTIEPTQSADDYDRELIGQTVTLDEWCRLTGYDPATRRYA